MTTIVCAVLGIVIGTLIILLIDLFVLHPSRQKKKKKSEADENEYLEVGQLVRLTKNAKTAIETIASQGGNLIDIPDSLIGRFVEIRDLKEKTSVSGIALAEYIYSPVTPSGVVYVRINILTLEGRLKAVDIPASNYSGKEYQINLTNHGAICRPGDFDAVQDIINFCGNQCIFDCKNCILSKYGVRKARGSEN